MKVTQIIQLGFALLLLAGAAYTGLGIYTVATNGTEYEYRYTVKAEQVNEDEMVNESVSYDNLTAAEQRVLFNAFKKSDHFLGGSSTTIAVDEPANVSNEWQVVEVKGVPILMAIQGPEKTTTTHEAFEALYVFPFGPIITLALLLWGLDQFFKATEQ